jgi:hypothetical protein
MGDACNTYRPAEPAHNASGLKCHGFWAASRCIAISQALAAYDLRRLRLAESGREP